MTVRCQQYELYTAERSVDEGRRFAAEVEAQSFIDAVVDQPWWDEQNPRVHFVEVLVRNAQQSRDGSVGCFMEKTMSGLMEMAKQHLDEHTLLHELAHITAGAKYGSHAHDPAFARELLELTFRVRGTEPWVALRNAFVDGGIVF